MSTYLTLPLLPLVFSIGALPALASTPPRPLKDYLHRFWGTADGLTEVDIIAQTGDRYLWLATGHGVVRFDGARFTVFGAHDNESWYPKANLVRSPVLTNYVIGALLADDDTLWVGTLDGGLSRIANGNVVRTYTTHDGLSDDSVTALYRDPTGVLWIGGKAGSLQTFRNGSIVTIRGKQPPGHQYLASIDQDQQGRLWITDETGILCLERGKFQRYVISDGGAPVPPVALLIASDDTLWIGTKRGLYHLEDGAFKRKWPSKANPLGHRVSSLARDRDGTIWFVTDNELRCFRRGRFDEFGTRNGLSGPPTSVFKDAENNIWIGTFAGLDRLADGPISSYTVQQGLSSDHTSSVIQDREGAIWIGSIAGLDRIQNNSIRSYPIPGGVDGIWEGPGGSLWFRSQWHVCTLRKEKLTNYVSCESVLPNRIFALAWMRDGRMLLSCRQGILSFYEGKLVPLVEAEPSYSLLEARDGTLWIGTRSRLLHAVNGSLTAFGNANDTYGTLYEDADGVIWAGSDHGGLIMVRGQRQTRFAPLRGPFKDSVLHIFEDTTGNLWLGTAHGLYRVRKSSLMDYAEGKLSYVFAGEFAISQGVPCCNWGGNGGWVDNAGHFWVPSERGVLVIDPLQIKRYADPPKAIIERMVVDGQETDHSKPVVVPPDHKRIEFLYTGIDFHAPEYMTFRYMLEGFDHGWVNADNRTTASYTTLRPGEYRFRMTAANRDGLWNDMGASVSLRVLPHFYQTLWFYGFCSVAIVLTTISAYRWRIRLVMLKVEAAALERARVAGEIHDTLLQDLSGASLMLQAISSKLSDDGVQMRLNAVLDQVQHCLAETRRALWGMHQANGGDWTSQLRQYAENLAPVAGIRLLVDVCGLPIPPLGRLEYDVLRIGKEAVLNSIKHSGASEVRAEVLFNGSSLLLSIKDNGRGFNAQRRPGPEGHWGLLGMCERAEKIGGKLIVSSTLGCGTTVELILPVAAVRSFPKRV